MIEHKMLMVLILELTHRFSNWEYFLRVAKSLSGLLSGYFTFRYIVVCSILDSQNSENNLRMVAIQKV